MKIIGTTLELSDRDCSILVENCLGGMDPERVLLFEFTTEQLRGRIPLFRFESISVIVIPKTHKDKFTLLNILDKALTHRGIKVVC